MASPPAACGHAVTPARRALSADPPSLRTPLDSSAARDPVASFRRSAGRRNINSNAPTPHAVAARLALSQRRHALFTPGKNRRRSLMEQRETPLGILRNLSRALAPASKPILSSPRDASSAAAPVHDGDGDDDDDDEYEDDELPIDRPRLSLPLDQEDDSDLPQPRSSGLEEENYTAQSIELPRRALSEQPRLSRSSFGNVRVSDFFDQSSHNLLDDAGRHSDFFPGLLEDIQARAAADDFTLDRIDADPTRRTTMGRDSDFGLQIPAGLDDQTTFLLSEPPTDLAADSAVIDRSLAEDAAPAQDLDGLPDAPPDAFPDAPPDASLVDGVNMSDGADEDIDVTVPTRDGPTERAPSTRKRHRRVSKHGIEYPPLPPSLVKKVAQTVLHSSGLSNPRISADTLTALTQASDWFFEQLGDDLGAYAKHAKRKTVEESDVVALMRRQRQIGPDTSMFSVAQRHLPRELLQELRMPVPQPAKKRRLERSHDGEDGRET